MKVDNRIKDEATVQFQDIATGDVYEDNEGLICIKTSNEDYCDSPYGECIAFIDDKWKGFKEHREVYVKPLEATITIYEYKTKARN